MPVVIDSLYSVPTTPSGKESVSILDVTSSTAPIVGASALRLTPRMSYSGTLSPFPLADTSLSASSAVGTKIV